MRPKEKTKDGFRRVTTAIHEAHIAKIDELIESRPTLSKRDIIHSALRKYFNPEESQSLESLIIQSLKRIEKRTYLTQEHSGVIFQTILTFVKVWLSHTPEVPLKEKDALAEAMERRFSKFQEILLREMRLRSDLGEKSTTSLSDEDLERTLSRAFS